jgi:hypothetical protein
MTDQELKDLVASLAVAQAKTDAQLAKTDAQLAKTDAQLAKTDAQLAKTDAQLAKTDAQLEKLGRRVDEVCARVDSVCARVDSVCARVDSVCARVDSVCARVDSVCAQLGGIANNQGDVAEEFFYHALEKHPVIGGVHFDRVEHKVYVGRKQQRVEFDVLLYNGNSLAIVEVKYKVHLSALNQLERLIENYRTIYPEYGNYKIYAGIAGLSVPAEVIEQAHSKGFFVLKQQGEAIVVDSAHMRSLTQ